MSKEPKPIKGGERPGGRRSKPARGSFSSALKASPPAGEAGPPLGADLSAHASPLSLIHPSQTDAPLPPALKKGARGAKPVPPLETGPVKAPKAKGRTTGSAILKSPPPAPATSIKWTETVPAPAANANVAPASTVPPPEAIRPAAASSSEASASPSPKPRASASETVGEAPPPPAPKPATPTSEPTPGHATGPAPEDPLSFHDVESLARNIGAFIEHSGKAAAAYLQPREADPGSRAGEEVVQTMNSLGKVAESWLTNPAKMMQAQAALSTQLFSLWNSSLARFSGGQPAEAKPVSDKRFAAPEWRETPFFDFLHQAYLVTTDWAKAMVDEAEGVDQATREKAAFYLRQIASAMSPSNYLATNPELLKETVREKGENLVRGMKMLAEDIEAGKGELKIRQTDATRFTLGVDMASTPGKVILRNDLMELIQYAPLTDSVLKRPLLIVPPWINKFYVLDLNKEKSLVRWAVSQGLTVFIISWVNPDARHAAKDWEAYMREGIFAALDAVEQATGEREVATAGYCVGGTLLAASLAFMAAKGDRRVTSATFLTTQVDFEDAGDLKVFADEAQIRTIEQQMAKKGYLAGSRMANAFNMLRPDDLIWSYSVNTYLKGQQPRAFDLLTWNADATRMPAANHAFYLRNCYLENKLTRGEMVIAGETLNLKAVTIPIYDLAAKEDHIAPARSVYNGSKFFGGPVRYVLSGSGHIAGVVNPPAKAKYGFWSDGKTDGDFEAWVSSAKETPGSWWVDWIAWLHAQAPTTVPARTPGDGKLTPLCDAPGEYVRVQS